MKFAKLWAENFGALLLVIGLIVVAGLVGVIPWAIAVNYGLDFVGIIWGILYCIALLALGLTVEES